MSILAFAAGTSSLMDGVPVNDYSGTTSSYKGPYSREHTGLMSTSDNASHITFDPITGNYWVSFYAYLAGGTWGNRDCLFLKSGSQTILTMRATSSENCQFTFYNGTSTLNVGGTGAPLENQLYRIDIEVDRAVSGAIRVYSNFGLRAEYLGDTSAMPSPDSLHLNAHSTQTSSTYACRISSIFIADEDSRAITAIQNNLTADGVNTDFSGGYVEVNKFGALDDSTKIVSTAANQVSSMVKSALPTEFNTGYEVVALGLYSRSAAGITGETNMEFLITDNTNTQLSGDIAVGSFYSPKSYIFDTAPDGLAWDVTKLNAADIGVKSKA